MICACACTEDATGLLEIQGIRLEIMTLEDLQILLLSGFCCVGLMVLMHCTGFSFHTTLEVN